MSSRNSTEDDSVKTGEIEDVRILAFLCNWCSYAGADLAGVSRMQYPPNVQAIRVMCTGTNLASLYPEGLSRGNRRRPHRRLPHR